MCYLDDISPALSEPAAQLPHAYTYRPETPDSAPSASSSSEKVFVENAAGRALDVSVALVALVIFLPLLVLLCLAIWLQDGGRPIFAHPRIGRGGKMFPCLKLRSMVTNSEECLLRLLQSDPQAAQEWRINQKLRNDPRITPLGAFLRKTSLDELPQLLNVVLGHMSLVGPRPIVASEVARYGRYFKFYCAVRPGITGLWQVSGRSDVSYRRRVAMDTIYTKSRSLSIDLWIMGRTVPAVLMSRGSC